jgi:predicted kinase
MEVIIMVGLPASGKKEYAKKHYVNYSWILRKIAKNGSKNLL